MTSIEWFLSELEKVNYHPTEAMIMYAKKLERQEHSKTWDEALRIFEARGHNFVRAWEDFDEWYETFVSKGSDERIVDTNKTITEISDESWEGCDGCTEQDEIMYKNGYVKGYNAAISELPKEISDEKIEKAARDYDNGDIYGPPLVNFEQGAFWYREQLKQRQ